MKEYVRRVKVTVEESWSDPEEMAEEGGAMDVGENMDGEADESLITRTKGYFGSSSFP